ncbi:MAG: hypothetical protein ACLQSR_01505 [Limisphaerales bacterium]
MALLIAGSSILFYLTPLSIRGGSWGQSVLLNWHDFGFFNLKGQLAYNPGGYGLPGHPDIYSGHRAYGLYPAYFMDWIFGDCEGGLAFFLFFSAIVGLSVWFLLGCGVIGTITAALVVFSASFLRMVPTLDLFDIPVLFGIPFLFRVRELLNREKMTPASLVILLFIVFLYIPLNWTTIVALGITLAYLTVARPINFKRILGFASLLAVGSIVILAISLASKVGGNSRTGTVAHFLFFYHHYLIGPGGYDDQGMTWIKAVSRLTVVNLIALLPLWLVFFWKIARIARSEKTISKNLLLCLSPLLVAIFFIAVLRNYFAHHPWMSGPVLIYGVVFSLRLLLDRQGEGQITGARHFWGRIAVPILAGFIYGMIVLAWLNANAADVDSVLKLARENTPRKSIIFYSPSDSGFAPNADRFAIIIDRQVVPLTDSNSIPQELQYPGGEKFYITSHVLPENPNWLARTENEKTPGIIASTLNWYRKHISRRAPGDRIEMPGGLYLYKMP